MDDPFLSAAFHTECAETFVKVFILMYYFHKGRIIIVIKSFKVYMIHIKCLPTSISRI